MSLAIIGGSGLYQLEGLEVIQQLSLTTPFGEPSDKITKGKLQGKTVFFLPRHGQQHHLPPHKINYRANIYALSQLGVKSIVAVNAVGGISEALSAGDVVIPEQLIDYSYGREHTFSDGVDTDKPIQHIDFTHPYSTELSQQLVSAAKQVSCIVVHGGTYGCTQGPRLETAAEIRRMAHDGCTLVGMTAMPEAALAAELGIGYSSLCVVANMAAGLSDIPLTIEDIHEVMNEALGRVRKILSQLIIELPVTD